MVGGARPTSFARGLRVLSVVVDRGEARADVVAGDLGVPISTVYRYLKDLRAAGFVAEVDGSYRLGDRLASVSRSTLSRSELRRVARPTLEWLAAASGETALIAVRAHTHALCLDQVESHHGVRMAFRIGEPLPLHAGAASRVLLAYAPDDVVDAVLRDLSSFTPATPSAENLPRRLAAIRSTGFVTSRGELMPGATAIATPVLDEETCLCSLALAAPERRANAAWQRQAKKLLETARTTIEALI